MLSSDVDGIVVLREGRTVFEWYDGGFGPGMPHLAFSVSKSICGAVCGILEDQGYFSSSDAVTDYLPELRGSAYSDCLIQHALDMSVAVAFDEDYSDPRGDCARYRVASGWDPATEFFHERSTKSLLTALRSNGDRHGETFHYVSPNTDLLGWLCERVTGLSYGEVLSQYLWTPMGAEHGASVTVDGEGISRAAGGISLSVRDLARFGEMIRNGGLVERDQVVPKWWIDETRKNGNSVAWSRGGPNPLSELFPTAVYRNKWFNVGKSVLFALGIHGQGLYIDHESQVVIARVSSRSIPADLENEKLWTKVYQHLALVFGELRPAQR